MSRIYTEHFARAAMLSSKTFDSARLVLFRKHLGMSHWLAECKPSSVPAAELVERRGSICTHHVFWLHDELDALRDSLSYRELRRAPNATRRNETALRSYLNSTHRSLARLAALVRAQETH